jgi:hypothetical protein
VDIQSHRGIDALHHRHGAGVSVLNAAETQSSLSGFGSGGTGTGGAATTGGANPLTAVGGRSGG